MIVNNPKSPLGNLPQRPTRFVGQAQEVMRLATALDEHRVVTVTGPGGVGKTRTAIELAKRLIDFFPDGVWFVNLALLDDGSDVGPFVCETLRDIAPLARDARSFATSVSDRRALLVFDSCEHLLVQAGEFVSVIAQNAPNVRVVVTSREALGIPGEFEHRLQSLAMDDAMELFFDRARSAGVPLGDDRRPMAAAIVHRLDAIPLAIELAAPLLRSMTLDELFKHVNDGLEVLAMANAGAPSRQQTLQAVYDSSHRLLGENAQKLFRRLAIFVGSFTLEAAMLVCSDERFNEARLSEALVELVAKSLVIADAADGTTRYRMLEITRAYAQNRLFESKEYDEAALAFVRYFVVLARRYERVLESMPVHDWQAMVQGETQNFRAALSLALDAGDVESLAAICESLHFWFWSNGAVHAADLTRRIETILATTMEPAAEAPLQMAYAALLRRSNRNRALDAAKRAYDLYRSLGDAPHFSDALRCTSSLQHDVLGAPSAKLAGEIQRYADLMLEMGSTLRAAELLNNLGVSYAEMLDDDRLADARVCFERAAGLLEARGDRERAGRVIGNSSVTAYLSGDVEQAVRWSGRAVEFFDRDPESMEAGHQWSNYGFHLAVVGRYDQARAALQRSMQIAIERNDREGLSEALENAAYLAHVTDGDRLAVRLLGAANALLPRDLARQARDATVMRTLVDTIVSRLGQKTYDEEYDAGLRLPLEQIIRETREAVGTS